MRDKIMTTKPSAVTTTLENLTLAGKPVCDAAFFKTNEFVDGLIFVPGAVSQVKHRGNRKEQP